MIKNLIFDCGGVIFNVDYALSLEAFKTLSTNVSSFGNISINQFKHIASDFEIGKQTIDEFYIDIRNRYFLNATNEQIKKAWNAMLLGFIPESTEIIQKLKAQFTVSLFTNTNELHYLEFEPECKKLLKIFDHCFYSHKIGLKKPNIESFRYILNFTGFKPEETLFIDDSEENVIASSKLGIVPFHFTNDWNLQKLYNYLINEK